MSDLGADAMRGVPWPSNGLTEIPFRLYTDPGQYRLEQERIFKGPTRRSGAPTAGGRGLRGCALDRPDLARVARPHGRADAQPAGIADRDVPPGVPAAVDRPAISSTDLAGART